MKLKPPSGLTATQQRRFEQLAVALEGAGIDPRERIELLTAFVQSDARVAGLRQRERTAKPEQRMPLTRALSVALAEARRLHSALFKGGHRRAPSPTPQERAAANNRAASLMLQARAAHPRVYAALPKARKQAVDAIIGALGEREPAEHEIGMEALCDGDVTLQGKPRPWLTRPPGR